MSKEKTFIGKLLRGAKGIGISVVEAVIPNITKNIASEIGGEGKVHIPGAIAGWATTIITIASVVWVIYRLVTGTDLSIIKEEVDLIQSY